MRFLILFVGWCILLVLCWPVALLAVVLFPAGLAAGTAVSTARDDRGSVARARASRAVFPGQVVQWPAPRLRSAAVSARGYNAAPLTD